MVYTAMLLQQNGEIIHGYIATKPSGAFAQSKLPE
jgi:hypothetical protein